MFNATLSLFNQIPHLIGLTPPSADGGCFSKFCGVSRGFLIGLSLLDTRSLILPPLTWSSSTPICHLLQPVPWPCVSNYTPAVLSLAKRHIYSIVALMLMVICWLHVGRVFTYSLLVYGSHLLSSLSVYITTYTTNK